MKHQALEVFGWDEALEAQWLEVGSETFVPGRVIADFGVNCKVALPEEVTAEAAGRLHYVSAPHEWPKVGDWVAVQVLDGEHDIIHAVLPRKNEISRKRPGEPVERQVLAANVDVAFLVQALDDDFSPRRFQRYLFQLRRERIKPIIVLNKADKADDIAAKVDELKALDVDIIISSALEHQGIDKIAEAIAPGQTAVFLGSSGVGKSTITNVLLGEQRQATRDIRDADSKGRHTTSHRELFRLPNGGLVIDTPGLRELQLWGNEGDLEGVFPDVEELAAQCKFANCTHSEEPDCAVLQAVETGALGEGRLAEYLSFQKELRYLATQTDVAAAQERKQSHKKAQKQYNQMTRPKRK